MRGNPIADSDPTGRVTFEQINAIATQMGLQPIATPQGAATDLIQQIQTQLGVKADGDLGPATVSAYEAWAKNKNLKPVALRDPKKATEVLGWIVKYWPKNPKCPPPVAAGEFLALIYYESRDSSTRQNGRPTNFNAAGGPYGSKGVRTTAVGLAQFTAATASRDVAYDGEKSIEAALQLMFRDAERHGCDFEAKNAGLNRWEAWRTHKNDIQSKGAAINDLINGKYRGDASKVTDDDIMGILEPS
jgi:hypothetical protein